MEKFTNTVRTTFCFGLLILNSILFSPFGFSQGATRFTGADAAKLLVEPKEDAFFTNQESKFVLKIQKVDSADVQVDLPAFPEGVVFNSSKREDFAVSQFERGIQFEFCFIFERSGEFTLPPLVLSVQGTRYIIRFKTVQVYQNPMTIQPRVIVVFDDGKTIVGGEKQASKISLTAGASACFTVYLQYGVQLQQFVWSIPKDSVFKELKRYEIEKNVQKPSQEKSLQKKINFSAERIPVAYFEWIPLKEGTVSLPGIRLMATAYSGRATVLGMPECVVEILPPTAEPALPMQENFFAYAFAQEPTGKADMDNYIPGINELEKLVQLRSQERHKFFQANVRTERFALEEKIGIQNSVNEPSVPIFILFASVFVVLIATTLLSMLVQKKMFAAFSAVFSLVFLFFAVLFSHKIFDRCGIVTGGSISPVPEDSALTKIVAGVGSRVVVHEEIEGWYYIEYNESGGWIKKENLVLIK